MTLVQKEPKKITIRKSSRLPVEYQEVEYIESSGTQYINTGVKASNTLSTELVMRPNMSYTSEYTIFGDAWSASALFLMEYNGKYRLHNGNSYGDFANVTDVKTTITTNNTGITINGTSYTLNAGSGYSNNNIWLFATGDGSNTNKRGRFKVYSLKISNSGTLVRNFVPCYRIADGVIGMYDIVNDVFYTNSGTGTFTKGNDVNSVEIEIKRITIRPNSTEKQIRPVITKEWDLSKITLNGTYNTGTSSIFGAYIDPSGTRLYINRESVSIMQKTLSTPRDVSTATGSSSLSVSNINGQGIWLSNDGTLLFIFAYNGNVYKFTLSTPRDITTATQTQSVNAAHGGYNPTGGIMSTDGKYMYTCYQNNVVKLFYLSTAFDLSTATSLGTISSGVGTTRGLGISDDYKHIYGGADSKMWQIDLQAPHDLNNFTVQSRTMSPGPNNFYFGGGLVNSNNLLVTTDGRYVRTWNIV